MVCDSVICLNIEQSFRNTSVTAIITLITQYVLLNCRYLSTKLHNVTSQKYCVRISCCEKLPGVFPYAPNDKDWNVLILLTEIAKSSLLDVVG